MLTSIPLDVIRYVVAPYLHISSGVCVLAGCGSPGILDHVAYNPPHGHLTKWGSNINERINDVLIDYTEDRDGSAYSPTTSLHFRNGVLHHATEPAIVTEDNYQAWYWEGDIHRFGGGPAIILGDGKQIWCHYGNLHRIGGQAIISTDGSDEMYRNLENYWLNNVQYEKSEYDLEVQKIRRRRQRCMRDGCC